MRMSAIRLVAGAILFLLVLAPAGAKKNKEKRGWDPIPPEELALKEHPTEKGAGALVLYKEDVVDQNNRALGVYRRIKILNESGRKYASLEIPYLQGERRLSVYGHAPSGWTGRWLNFRERYWRRTSSGAGV